MYCRVNDDFQGLARVRSVVNGEATPIRICIVGGGFGGLYTALQLSQFRELRSRHCQITLIEPRDHFLFTPLLYEVITGELHPWEIAPSYNQLLAGSGIQWCQAEVQDVDLPYRVVKLTDGTFLTYDYLVLAVGGEMRLAGVAGAMENAQPFRSLADAEHLRERLRFLEASDRQVIRVAIAGAGPNGVELACKLADHLKGRGHISLIDRGEDILKSFSQGSRVAAYRALAKRGVHLELSTSIEAIAPDSITLTTPERSHTLPTDLVLWTAGTQIRPWVSQLQCHHNSQGQIITQPTLQLVDYPEVFALGDLAEIRNPNKDQVPATAQAAFQQAPHTARNLRALLQGRRSRPFRYLHLGEMLTLGTNAAVVSSFGVTLDGELARLIRRGVYIQRLPTLKHRFQVAVRWVVNGIWRRLPLPGRRLLRRLISRWLPHLDTKKNRGRAALSKP